jgi:hypothetical protein
MSRSQDRGGRVKTPSLANIETRGCVVLLLALIVIVLGVCLAIVYWT